MADTAFGGVIYLIKSINPCAYVTCDPEILIAEIEPSDISVPMGKVHLKISVGLLLRIVTKQT